MSSDNKADKKKLLSQILKFAVVGGISCVIDFAVYSAMYYGFLVHMMSQTKAAAIASVFGFGISLIFNYIASMAFVFERRENTSKLAEFVIFAVLSLIGMGLNTAIIVGVMWLNETFVVGQTNLLAVMVNGINGLIDLCVGWMLGVLGKAYTPVDWVPIEAKVIATAIVMVYNFISRKMTLEKK